MRPNDDLSCSCSQCNDNHRRRRAPTAPIVHVLRDVAARIAVAEPRKTPPTLPEAMLW